MYLPKEILEHIFYFCDEETLSKLKTDFCFKNYHKRIDFILDKRTREYWNKIQIQFVASKMESIMTTHQENMFFGGFKFNLTEERIRFMDEWHQSDIEFCVKLSKLNIEEAILYLKNEKDRLNNRYRSFEDLEDRPQFLNRYLVMSLQEMFNLYMHPPQH